MSAPATPFDRGRRRRASGLCEVPGCGRPHIGPVGIITQTIIVYPCEVHAIERYGSADPWDIIAVLFGDEPFASGAERNAAAFGRELPRLL